MKFIILFVLLISTINLFGQNPLNVPDTLSGSTINLDFISGTRTFFAGTSTNTIGLNGNYLGPTLMLRDGEQITINVTNNLTDSTTLHWHGMHVPAQADGGPHVVIPPSTTWSPSFQVKDKASTHWYHPHLHMRTAEHVTMGAAGFIIVRDTEEDAIVLPRTYGQDDIPLVLQTRAFDANSQFVVESALDSVVLVNGTMDPYLELPANVVRLRLLNGATERSFNIGFSNNMMFHQIGSDGGLLNSPVVATRLLISPGERAEILVNLDGLDGQSIYLMSYASQIPAGIYGATNPQAVGANIIPDYQQNPLNGSDFNLLRIDVTPALANGVTTIPSTLANVQPIPASSAVKTRDFLFMPEVMGPTGSLIGPFVINMMPFDMMMINDTVILNDIEIWQLTNQTRISHPFHIHDVQFFILDINGMPPPPHLQGRKDVVLVPPQQGVVRIIAHFNDYADSIYPYMYHCHMLTHEDHGMMGQFVVIDTTTSGLNAINESDGSFIMYPNPKSGNIGFVTARFKSVNEGALVIYGAKGNEVFRIHIADGGPQLIEIATSQFSSGIYFVKLETAKTIQYQKLVITN